MRLFAFVSPNAHDDALNLQARSTTRELQTRIPVAELALKMRPQQLPAQIQDVRVLQRALMQRCVMPGEQTVPTLEKHLKTAESLAQMKQSHR